MAYDLHKQVVRPSIEGVSLYSRESQQQEQPYITHPSFSSFITPLINNTFFSLPLSLLHTGQQPPFFPSLILLTLVTVRSLSPWPRLPSFDSIEIHTSIPLPPFLSSFSCNYLSFTHSCSCLSSFFRHTHTFSYLSLSLILLHTRLILHTSLLFLLSLSLSLLPFIHLSFHFLTLQHLHLHTPTHIPHPPHSSTKQTTRNTKMSSYKRQFLIQSYQQQQQQQQQAQEDTPWLRYPDPQKSSSNGHSRSSLLPATPHNKHTSSNNNAHASRSETSPANRLHHKRSSSKLIGTSQSSSHHTHSNNSSNASLPMSLASNSSSDSLAHNNNHHQYQSHHHHHQQQQQQLHPFTPPSNNNNNKPRSLSEELSFATQGGSNNSSSADDSIHRSSNTNIRHPYPSPITPSDLLSIPNPSASPSSASSSSAASASSNTSLASPFPLQRARVDSVTGQRLRPSPLSINTNLSNPSLDTSAFLQQKHHQSPSSVSRGSTVVADGGGLGSPCANLNMSTSSSGLGTPPLPRLTRSSTHSSSSSSSSVSSCSNTSSPSSSTAPCSALCHHHSSSTSKGHGHGHSHHHHHNGQRRHSHRSSCHLHKHQPREHHPSCHLHGSPSLHHRHDSKLDRAPPKGVLRFEDPPTTPGREGIDHDMNVSSSSLIDEAVVAALPEPTLLHLDEMPMAIEKAPASTAVTIVGSTPTYGMGAYKAQRDQEEMAAESSLGLYSAAEPPKKRQRSAAAYLFGAAFETVIFTSAVALSAYQLLTGKGRQQGLQDASVGAEGETVPSAEGSDAISSVDQSLMVS
ncbi:hypothetical protein BKA57DRAFT_283890 [Linnemannia elongata]|nr:hypothetical protein BKA57DRAFT_283890 [Linnemannia elongata]